MVMTRAQEVTTSHAGRQRQEANPLVVGPSAPPADVPAPPPQQLQKDRLAALTTQVQSLVAVVQGLQHHLAAVQQPELLPLVPGPFRGFCTELGIHQRFTSVGHPQTNGAAEVTNRIILQGLRARLDDCKGRWVEELHSVLWAYHTTPRAPTGETPFSLVFASEVVIPVEIGSPSPRVEAYSKEDNPSQL